jgi:predicted ATP-binding protein involved in virulence
MALPMLTAMRVRSISVRKLFGRFDHVIPLNGDERVTIIHGPNGYGKTALLRLVYAAFRLDVDTLRATPFEALRVELDDGAHLEVCFEVPRGDPEPAAVYRIGDEEQVLSEFIWGTPRQNYVDTARYAWQYAARRLMSGHRASTRDLFAFLTSGTSNIDYLLQKVWLHHIPVHLVSVQRLLTPSQSKGAYRSGDVPIPFPGAVADEELTFETFEKTVTVYSKELRRRVQEIQSQYARESQYIDRTFPMRAMKAMNELAPSDTDLERKLLELEQQRRRLDVFGILPSEDSKVEIPKTLGDEAARKILWLYACDVADKLMVFEELARRMALLQEIINQRFQFKRLKIDVERGFVFESDTGQELPPTALSSGEQHQLVMVYECLFKIDRDALLLIDEPELSLHVSWQVEFLRDLQRIIEIAQFDVLLATHSPQIIHDRWDLTLELQPPPASSAPVAADASVAGAEATIE